MSQDDDQLVERVARAICEIDSDDTWEDDIDSSRAHYRWLARAAIAALPPQGDGLAARIEALESRQRVLREALERVLLDIEFMWQDGTLDNRRDDIIYVSARAALAGDAP